MVELGLDPTPKRLEPIAALNQGYQFDLIKKNQENNWKLLMIAIHVIRR
jgi:hypothetical protein